MLLILLEVSVKVTHWLTSLGLMLKDYFYATCTFLLVKATCQSQPAATLTLLILLKVLHST